jgi:hypothetical protein
MEPTMADLSTRADRLLAAVDAAVDAIRDARMTRTPRPAARPASTDDAIRDLRRSHDELAGQVRALQRQANTTLIDLLQGFAAFERRFRAVKAQNRVMQVEAQRVKAFAIRRTKELALAKVNARVQAFTSAATTMQTAAYGHKGALWHRNNVLLAGNQLLWTFADPLLRKAGILRGPSPGLLTVLAPVGMLLTGHIALGNQQHVRFVSGIAILTAGSRVALESLRHRIASGLWPAFRRRRDVPVTVVSLDGDEDTTYVGVVENGILRITSDNASEGVTRVAWMVDTGADIG